jgi:hypothetical protein
LFVPFAVLGKAERLVHQNLGNRKAIVHLCHLSQTTTIELTNHHRHHRSRQNNTQANLNVGSGEAGRRVDLSRGLFGVRHLQHNKTTSTNIQIQLSDESEIAKRAKRARVHLEVIAFVVEVVGRVRGGNYLSHTHTHINIQTKSNK